MLRAEATLPPDVVYVEGYHAGIVDQPYDATLPHNRAYETHLARRRLALLERFARPGRMLDVGGGIGTFACAAIARGWKAELLEPVPDAVEDARRHGVPARVGGVDDLGPDGYDAISMLHVLEHLPEARAALERVRDALRPGGLVLVEVPNVGSATRRSTGSRWGGWWPGQHVNYFSRRSLTEVLRRAGFDVLTVRSITLSWDGLMLGYHAYIVGLQPALQWISATRRRFRTLPAKDASAPETPRKADIPPPLREERPARRALLPFFTALSRIEERLGAGENLIAVARAPARRA